MARVDQLRQLVQQRGERVFERAVEDMQRRLVDAAPHASGLTAERTRVTPIGRGTTLVAEARSDTPQAGYTNDGTKPHIIRPRRGPVLVFEGDSGLVFTRIVHHPGNKATHWFTKTVARWPAILRQAAGSVR